MTVVCTNCGISGAQLFNWRRSLERSMEMTARATTEERSMIGWPLRYDKILAGEKVDKKEIKIVTPPNYICCDPPYVVGRTEVPFEELVFRSLPHGEDR